MVVLISKRSQKTKPIWSNRFLEKYCPLIYESSFLTTNTFGAKTRVTRAAKTKHREREREKTKINKREWDFSVYFPQNVIGSVNVTFQNSE